VDDLLFLSPDLFPLHFVLVFLFGAALGSFFNVCIYRIPLGQSVNRPHRSFCPSCGMTIAWYDNIPLWSYVALGGLCRRCGAGFSSRYFWVELLTGLLFAAVFWVHRFTPATPLFLVLTSFLIIATFTDIDHWIIPDSISLGGAAVGVVAAGLLAAIAAATGWTAAGQSLYVSIPFTTMGPWGIAANAAVGTVFGYVLLWAIGVLGTLMFRKEAMGMGDMKLFACIGAFLGWEACILVLALSSFVGATFGISLILAQWIVAKLTASPAPKIVPVVPSGDAPAIPPSPPTPGDPLDAGSRPRQLHHLPFGPYIAIATYAVILFYRPMTEWLGRNLLLFDLLPR